MMGKLQSVVESCLRLKLVTLNFEHPVLQPIKNYKPSLRSPQLKTQSRTITSSVGKQFFRGRAKTGGKEENVIRRGAFHCRPSLRSELLLFIETTSPCL